MPNGEFLNVRQFSCWQERGETEAFFEADDSVLEFEVVDATLDGEDEERERDKDGPVTEPRVFVSEVDRDVDGDPDIDHEDGKDEEMYEWVDACVVFVILLGCHGGSLSFDWREQISTRELIIGC